MARPAKRVFTTDLSTLKNVLTDIETGWGPDVVYEVKVVRKIKVKYDDLGNPIIPKELK